MPDNKKTLKEKRQERQKEKVDKFTENIKSEARQAGYNVDTPIDIGPMGSERKKRIDETINQGVEGEIKTGLEKIQSLRTPPDVEIPEMPNPQYNIKDVRKQNMAKVGDILTSFSKGYRGQQLDPTFFRDKLKSGLLSQFEQYKGSSEAAKKTLRDWETNYINEQLDYINKRLQDPGTSELQKYQLEKARVQLENERVKKGITEERLKQLQAKGKIKPEEAPTARLSQEAGERTRITRDIPIDEAKQLEKRAKLDKEVKPIELQLQSAQQELASMGNEGTGKLEFIDKKKRNELEQKIIDLTAQKQSVYDKYYPNTQTPPNSNSTGNAFQDILNKNK